MSRRAAPIQYPVWEPHLGITKDGKHIYSFARDFPLVVFGSRCPYYTSHYPNHHDYYEISLNCGGSGLFHVGNRMYEFHTNDVAIVGSDEVHGLQAIGEDHLDLLHLFFMPEVAFQTPGDEAVFDLVRPFLEGTRHILKAEEISHAALRRIILKMHYLLNERPSYHRLLVRQQLFELLLLILKHYDRNGLLGGGMNETTELRRGKMHRLNPVFRLVAREYREQISLDEAARAAAMSRNYFFRFFRDTTGTTFVEYLNRYRISQAKQMILERELTASQIAYRVGFNNVGYFLRVFRKYTHLSPRQFVAEYNTARR